MPTLISWGQLRTKVENYRQIYGCENNAAALAFVVLKYLLDLTPGEIEDSITDGSNDRGVDAVYVDERDSKATVHLFQFKYTSTFDNCGRNFPSSEIDKILSFVSDLLARNTAMKKSCNQLLWEKVREIWDLFDRAITPTFIVHFCSNMQGLVSTEHARLIEALRPYRFFEAKEYTLETICSLIIERETPRLERTIQLVDKQYFERGDGNIRGLIATVEANQLIEMIRDPDDSGRVLSDIFNDNVRVYLTNKNPINAKIIESAVSEHNAEFWYLNNGITMTCDSFEYPPGTRAPKIRMTNVQIVNGGQTSNALFEAHKMNPERTADVLVLVRIYETRQREISGRIAESTNSQTPIGTRDLRSNDRIQKKLEQAFQDMGYFYERKEEQFKEREKAKRIDALEAGQAFLAYFLELPHVASTQRGKVFKEYYEHIFNDDLTAAQLLVPLEVLRPIEQKKRDIQRAIRKGQTYDAGMLFLIDGAYHLLYTTCSLCDIRQLDKLDAPLVIQQLDEAIELIVKVVNEEKANDPAFSYKRFFKSKYAKTQIDKAILLTERTSQSQDEAAASVDQ